MDYQCLLGSTNVEIGGKKRMRIEFKVLLLLFISLFGSVAILLACDKNERQNQPAQTKVAETKPEKDVPTFANLALVRAGVYDSGTGVAIITTGEKHDATVALTQLVGRQQCWRDKFPERFKRMRTETTVHRTTEESAGSGTWGNTLPWAFVITYDVE